MTMTIMYLTVAFLLAALAVSAYARVRGLDFDRGGSPLDIAVILLVIGLVIDLAAQFTIGSQGWLNSDQQWRNAVEGPPKLPSLFLWKIGLAAQSIAAIGARRNSARPYESGLGSGLVSRIRESESRSASGSSRRDVIPSVR